MIPVVTLFAKSAEAVLIPVLKFYIINIYMMPMIKIGAAIEI